MFFVFFLVLYFIFSSTFYNTFAELKCWLLSTRRTILIRIKVPDSLPPIGTHIFFYLLLFSIFLFCFLLQTSSSFLFSSTSSFSSASSYSSPFPILLPSPLFHLFLFSFLLYLFFLFCHLLFRLFSASLSVFHLALILFFSSFHRFIFSSFILSLSDVEAEVFISDLANSRNITLESLLSQPDQLEILAAELAS